LALAGLVAPSPKARLEVSLAYTEGAAVMVSPITAWEIGNLARKGRINLDAPVRPWWDMMIKRSGIGITALSPGILASSTDLPDLDHADPADRIIIATAREYGMRIVTSDRTMLRYADKGHVLAVEM
jgi:PIN domain nuclease of toxin-antitoxin system